MLKSGYEYYKMYKKLIDSFDGPMTTAELVRSTGFSRSVIFKMVKALVEDGVVYVAGKKKVNMYNSTRLLKLRQNPVTLF